MSKQTTAVVTITKKSPVVPTKTDGKPKNVTLDAKKVLALKDYIKALEQAVLHANAEHQDVNKIARVNLELGLNWQEIYEFSTEAQAIGQVYSTRFGYANGKKH